MTTRATVALVVAALAVTAWSVPKVVGTDYLVDAHPSIEALAHGRFADAVHQSPAMGPLSIVVRAPVVAVADALGASERAKYRLGSLVCLLPGAVVALLLARMMRRRGQPWYAQLVVVVAFCAVPRLLRAPAFGHPEEALEGSLAVAGVLAAGAARPGLALGLLAAAIATKPPAVLAAAPAYIALPPDQRTQLIRSVGPAIAAIVVGLAGAAFAVRHRVGELLNTGDDVRYPSLWWPFATRDPRVVFDGVEWRVYDPRTLPEWFGRIPHAVIPLLVVPAGILQARFGRQGLAPALALLALLMLLRCVLDPVSNIYYHVPFVMALIAWEAIERRGLPIVTLLGLTALWFVLYKLPPSNDFSPSTVNIMYLATAAAVTVPLVAALSPQRDQRLRKRRQDLATAIAHDD